VVLLRKTKEQLAQQGIMAAHRNLSHGLKQSSASRLYAGSKRMIVPQGLPFA